MVIDWSSDEGGESKENELARPRLFWFNLLLFVAVIVVLVKSICLPIWCLCWRPPLRFW